ncbi:MAG: Mov34/MPN/PAD-1 family protein [Deltaproteobacteria bacterium]|nr:Mov34/MPN/PAD-1 family protein [Deltaproteobacteria bacterium]
MTAIEVPDGVRAMIYAHALAMFPEECCGYLTGLRDGTTVDGLVTCRNAQVDGEHPITPERGPESGFVIAGAELFAFARAFDGSTPPRIVYHSHGNGLAYFSDVDRHMARSSDYPVQHLVIGVASGEVTEVAQYAWSADAADFVEVARWRP